eukprot:g506.t1
MDTSVQEEETNHTMMIAAGLSVGCGAGIYYLASGTKRGYRVSGMKQGAYGKVPILSTESKMYTLTRPKEVIAAIKFKSSMKRFEKKRAALMKKESEDYRWCSFVLNKVSRSFAGVIAQLPQELRKCVCVFYLVLRALDTVEDEMDLAKFAPYVQQEDVRDEKREGEGKRERAATSSETAAKLREAKVRLIVTFTKRLFTDGDMPLIGIGEGYERELVEKFDRVRRVFSSLPPKYRDVIAQISDRMSRGMAKYVGRDLRNGTSHVRDYNRYCEIVAGYVGEGLSELWVASGLEDASLVEDREAIYAMGLFLQKTNIIRDYLEDLTEGRTFWPKEIWTHHSTSLKDLPRQDPAGRCVDDMVSDAFLLLPACLRYLQKLKTPSIFRFCAIPQLMAVATLSHVQKHKQLVYKGVLKIRKTQAAWLIVDVACSASRTDRYIRTEAMRVAERILSAGTPPNRNIASRLRNVMQHVATHAVGESLTTRSKSTIMSLGSVVTAAVLGYLIRRCFISISMGSKYGENLDAGTVAVLCMSLVYLYVALFMSAPSNEGRLQFRDEEGSIAASPSQQKKKLRHSANGPTTGTSSTIGATFYCVQEKPRQYLAPLDGEEKKRQDVD